MVPSASIQSDASDTIWQFGREPRIIQGVRQSPIWLLFGALSGVSIISLAGERQGWSPLTIFLINAAFLGVLAVIRRGITRPLMIALIFLQGIPYFGVGTVARLAPPIILVGLAIMWRIFVGRLHRSRLVARGDSEVVPNARGRVDDLIRMGFQMVGSADATGPGYKTIFTYLVAADRRTYAIATDRLHSLASAYGERVLVTTDRASMPAAPTELRQLIPRDLPGLYEAHKHALDVVGNHGHQPDHLVARRVIELSHAYEHRSLDYLSAHPWRLAARTAVGVARRQPPDSKPITDDIDSAGRIESWMAAHQGLAG